MTTLYRSALDHPDALTDWTIEGPAKPTFPQGRLRLESTGDSAEGQAANFVLWMPVEHPGDVSISWDFRPLHDPGLAMIFWAASGREGQSIHDPALPQRTGQYEQYHSGAIDAYHLSYYRRMWPTERRLHTCNLRKSHGFHLVAQGADPLPPVLDADGDYHLELVWREGRVTFSVEGIECLSWQDEGTIGGAPHRAGAIGLRQMTPLIAEYSNLRIEAL